MGRVIAALPLALVAAAGAIWVGTTMRGLQSMQRTDLRGIRQMEMHPAATRNHMTIITRGDETGGEYCVIEEHCRVGTPGALRQYECSPPPHIHPEQDEVFTVISGTFGYIVDGKHGTLPPGGSARIPAGRTHMFYNAGANDSQPLTMRFRLEPCGQADEFFETWGGLARDYGGLQKVPPLQVLLSLRHHKVELGDAPPLVKTLVDKVAVPLARALGYKPSYPEYRSAGGGGGAADSAQGGAGEAEQDGEAAVSS